MTFCEILSVESQGHGSFILSMVTDIFNEDLTAVCVEQFLRPFGQKTVLRRTISERQSFYDSFQRTREWVPAQQLGLKLDSCGNGLRNERKRKMDDGGEYTAKKIKTINVVSLWCHCDVND
jgi:hypothetical protein